MTDFFKQKVTIYNDIASDVVSPRTFYRFVIDLCKIQKGMLQNADGTIEKVPNAIMIETKDVSHYKPLNEYRDLAEFEKSNYYTANVNDFFVLAEVDDVVTNAQEFSNLKNRYKDIGFSVTAVNEYIHGMAVDNVQIIHA